MFFQRKIGFFVESDWFYRLFLVGWLKILLGNFLLVVSCLVFYGSC